MCGLVVFSAREAMKQCVKLAFEQVYTIPSLLLTMNGPHTFTAGRISSPISLVKLARARRSDVRRGELTAHRAPPPWASRVARPRGSSDVVVSHASSSLQPGWGPRRAARRLGYACSSCSSSPYGGLARGCVGLIRSVPISSSVTLLAAAEHHQLRNSPWSGRRSTRHASLWQVA